MKTKEQTIKEAWGEFWERLTDSQKEYALSNNGYCQIGYSREEKVLYVQLIESGLFEGDEVIRPKSLRGIKNNNGWVKIQVLADLPKNDQPDTLFEVGLLDENGVFHQEKKRCSLKSLKWMYQKSLITHYQPTTKLKPPIY